MLAAIVPAPDPSPLWWDLHARLMPDYNRRATLYWWTVVPLGAALIGWSLFSLAGASDELWLQMGLCIAMATLAGFVPVRVAGSTNSFTAGEIFIFLLLLLAGVEAATLASACEALVGSWRTSKRWTSRIASPAMAAIAMFVSGTMLQWLRGALHANHWTGDGLLPLAAIAFALTYFFINTLLVTMVPKLKRCEPLRLREMIRSFGWLGLAYTANATVATFLYLSFKQTGYATVIAAAPVIAILLTSGHYYFRRKEADEALRTSREAEVERTRQHVLALETSELRFHSAFTHASIGMALISLDGTIRQTNAALRDLLGLPEPGAGRLQFEQFVAADGSSTLAHLIAPLSNGGSNSLSAELQCLHREGSEVWVAVNASFFSEPASLEPCLILQLQDISARKRAEAELHHIAFHDGLTGLPNRHRFNEHLSNALARSSTDPSCCFGVLFLDFDRFKLINDGLGHAVGDEFLVQASRRIADSVRTGDVVARLGGDEFAILAVDRGDTAFVFTLAERLQHVLRQPFQVSGTEITTSASIGITFSSIGYAAPGEVLRDADIAMYKAKAAGKARFAVFDVGLHEKVAARLRMEGELRRALAEGSLGIHYQPMFDLRSGYLCGFEALARWTHAELGSVSPDVFIPITEESGLSIQLTDFVLRTACLQLKRWQTADSSFAGLKMHVNISGSDLATHNLVSRVALALLSARVEPGHLSIELTENILMEQLESAIGRLDDLHRLGVGLSIDDFGTGYSSLSHLSTLPLDCLKIDRSFVRNLEANSKEAAVIRAIVLLGTSLGKQVIAEGVETEAQRDELRALGCDIGQGFLLARPMPAEMIDELLASTLQTREADVFKRNRSGARRGRSAHLPATRLPACTS